MGHLGLAEALILFVPFCLFAVAGLGLTAFLVYRRRKSREAKR